MNEIANCAVPIVTICKTGLLDDTLIHKAMSHGAIFHATCNAILLLKDVNLAKTRIHYILLMYSSHIKQSSLINISYV